MLLNWPFFFFSYIGRRTVEPGPGAFLCSCHFVDGKKENGPTIFEHNEGKKFVFQSPEKKKRKGLESRYKHIV